MNNDANPQRPPRERAERAPVSGVSALNRQLQFVLKLKLESDANAAAVMHSLSYHVGQDTELASKVRNYAARLKFYVARLSALLPPDMRILPDAYPGVKACGTAALPLRRERATRLLMTFMLHHCETTPAMPLELGDELRAKGFEHLLQRVAGERARMAQWIARRQADEAVAAAHHDRPKDRRHPDATAGAAGHRGREAGTRRILHNPTQLVRWM